MVKRSSPSRRQIRGASGRGVMMGPYGPNPVIRGAEKSFGVRRVAARTPNRHWWSGREYQSDRANPGQGTRQIAPVPSA